MPRARRTVASLPRPLGPALALALAFATACADQASGPAAPPPTGEWRTFDGTWSASGDRRTLDAGADRQAAILDLSGSILLTGERGLGAGFQARTLAFSDGHETTVGSAVWTDERGDRIFSELRGSPVATGRRIVGTITGGTGRWAGITGEYGFDWTWVVETEGRMQGRTVGLHGRARIAAPGGGAR
ncbi:MAG TPA: hypothetical protein VFP65_07920 [Anaeromyxobacteraceae bacterium]|nr:hypothetical protein [Anaeromyxobacteraceae bacterium]